MAKMLTTTDNPFSPLTEWADWFAFDTEKGYNSCAYLARIARTSDELSDEENELEIDNAIDEICELNASGMHSFIVIGEGEGSSQ